MSPGRNRAAYLLVNLQRRLLNSGGQVAITRCTQGAFLLERKADLLKRVKACQAVVWGFLLPTVQRHEYALAVGVV